MEVPEAYLRSFKISLLLIILAFVGLGVYIAYYYFSSVNDYSQQNAAYELAIKGTKEMKDENYEAAIADYTQAIALDTTQDSFYVNRGTAYYNSGEMKEAKADWIKAAAMGSKSAINNLNLIKE